MTYRAGYSNLPNIASPRPQARPSAPATHEGTPAGNHSTTVNPKPKTTPHPQTGMPVMQSAASIRAAANSQAWKTIQQQQDLLPNERDIIAQYGARANAILPLIEAHRGWLEKAGEYTVSMANGLASMGQAAAGAADQTAGAGAASAGAGVGMNPGPTVSPQGVGMPAAVYGTSTGNYLHSLVPYADAIGGQSINKIGQDQGQALDDLRTAKQKIAGGLGDLQSKNYQDLTANALDVFKGKLASIAAREKNENATAGAAGTLAERTRHDEAMERNAARNAATSELRAKSAAKLADAKTSATGMTAGEKTSFQGFLKDADKKYHTLGGTKTPALYQVTMTLPAHKGLTAVTSTSKHEEQITGTSMAEVRERVRKFMDAHKPQLDPATGKMSTVTYSQGKITPQPNSTKLVGKKGESTRRLEAWRYLVAQNKTLGEHALSEADLRAAFRSMEGAPPGSK